MTDEIQPCAGKGRYARGEETRQRIIDTAVAIFGQKGFADTSTRDIAAAAGINTPAIQYYFDSKQGLYTACIEQLTGKIWDRIGPAFAACHHVMAGKPPLAKVIDVATALQDSLIDNFFADSEGLAMRRLQAWAEAENAHDPVSQLFKDRICLPIFDTYKEIAAYVASRPLKPLELQLHANALAGTSMVLYMDRSQIQDILNIDEIDDDFVSAWKKVAREHLRFSLIGLSKIANVHAPAMFDQR